MAMADSTGDNPTAQIIKLARFAVIGTLGLTFLLLVHDFVLSASAADTRFLTETVLRTIVYGIAIEIVAAIAAITCLALWGR
jgi:hypothetical protein